MKSLTRFFLGLTLLSTFSFSAAQTFDSFGYDPSQRPQLPKGMPAIEPEALEIIKGMTSKVAAARSIQFQMLVQSQFPSIDGLPIIYSTAAKVAVDRPDKFDIEVWGDGAAVEVLFTGNQLFAYSPDKKMVAVTKAPNNIDDAAQFAYEKAGLFFPGDDLILSNPYAHLTNGLTDAFVVGKTKLVGDVQTNVVVVANKDLQGQVWIGADDSLPYMASWVYLGDKSRPRTTVTYKNWKLNAPIPKSRFDPAKFKQAVVSEFSQLENSTK